MNPTADLLRSALALIEQPEHWCQGAWLTTHKGTVQWCVEGAHRHAAMYRTDSDTYGNAIDALSAAIGTSLLTSWNDAPERTHAEVVAAFRRAIAIAEGAP